MTSRRHFLVRTGQVGAVSAMAPHIRWTLPSFTRDGLVAPTAAVPAEVFSGLRWRMLGPFRAGRTDAVSGVPGRPHEFYSGSVNGGLWKTMDGGRVWEPVFDDQPVASIGAIAVAPSAPDTVYVGTGESTLRDSTGFGHGVYKSTDAGKTWSHLGLDDTPHRENRDSPDQNPGDNHFVAAIGHFYGDSARRGDAQAIWQEDMEEGARQGSVRGSRGSHDRPH